jgi:hypothetical protein
MSNEQQQRQAVEARCLHGKTVQQVASELGCGDYDVEFSITRASRGQLGEELQEMVFTFEKTQMDKNFSFYTWQLVFLYCLPGATDILIGQTLGISPSTVKTRLDNFKFYPSFQKAREKAGIALDSIKVTIPHQFERPSLMMRFYLRYAVFKQADGIIMDAMGFTEHKMKEYLKAAMNGKAGPRIQEACKEEFDRRQSDDSRGMQAIFANVPSPVPLTAAPVAAVVTRSRSPSPSRALVGSLPPPRSLSPVPSQVTDSLWPMPSASPPVDWGAIDQSDEWDIAVGNLQKEGH